MQCKLKKENRSWVQMQQDRRKELEYTMKTLQMFEFGSLQEALSRGGKAPTTTKWRRTRDNLFAAVPPLEVKEAPFAFVAGVREKRRERGLTEMKPKKAHLNARGDEEERVELPDAFEEHGRHAKLRSWLHGMRKAPPGWEDDNSRTLQMDRFRRGRAAPTIFFHPETQVRVVVHGDDFTFAGTDSELNGKCASGTVSRCARGIHGSGRRGLQEIEIFGRILR